MRILLANDDGYQARGLRTLARHLAPVAEVIIVAPDRNRSGASNSLTLDAPLRVERVEDNLYYINGTPTYAGRVWRGHRIEGLLLNSRMVQAVTRFTWHVCWRCASRTDAGCAAPALRFHRLNSRVLICRKSLRWACKPAK